MAIITPRRGEFFTVNGEPTKRFITWIEALTNQSNEVVGEVSEASELISGGSETDEILEGIEADLSLIMPHITDEIEDNLPDLDRVETQETRESILVTGAAFTTTGSQDIDCTSAAATIITLNLTPDDGEDVNIARHDGAVRINGDIGDGTFINLLLVGDSAHLIYRDQVGVWVIS